MKLETLSDIEKFAEYAVKAGIRSRGKMTVPMAVCAIVYGLEVGIGPMAALKGITAKGDMLTIDGDIALALARNHKACEYIHETAEGEGQSLKCTFTAKRKDQSQVIVRSFSWQEAKKAGLIGKAGPWSQYEARMMRYRALGFGLRDAFPEAMCGLHITQEIDEEEELLPDLPECQTKPREERREALKPQEAEGTKPPKEQTPPAPTEGGTESKTGGADQQTVKMMLKGCYVSYCSWRKLDLKSKASADEFKEACSIALACNETDVDSESKFTLEMVQKVKAYLDLLMGGEA